MLRRMYSDSELFRNLERENVIIVAVRKLDINLNFQFQFTRRHIGK